MVADIEDNLEDNLKDDLKDSQRESSEVIIFPGGGQMKTFTSIEDNGKG